MEPRIEYEDLDDLARTTMQYVAQANAERRVERSGRNPAWDFYALPADVEEGLNALAGASPPPWPPWDQLFTIHGGRLTMIIEGGDGAVPTRTTKESNPERGPKGIRRTRRVATDGGTQAAPSLAPALEAGAEGTSSPDGGITSDSRRITRRWAGYTAVELNRAGERVRVFHRTDGGSQWTHPYAEKCDACR